MRSIGSAMAVGWLSREVRGRRRARRRGDLARRGRRSGVESSSWAGRRQGGERAGVVRKVTPRRWAEQLVGVGRGTTAAGLEGNRAKCSVSRESRNNTSQSRLVRRRSSKDRTSSSAGHGGAEAPSDWISNSNATRKAARDGTKQQAALPVHIAIAPSGRGIGRKKKTALFHPFGCLLW
ncbi:hypothetical protein NL676_021384 [Syzygium grande]|nr:hypothetical protein NL676_021384 [Syzygium grande]